MAGNRQGGRKAVRTQYYKYGLHIFEGYAREGGRVRCRKGFAVLSAEHAAEMGRRGYEAKRRQALESAQRSELAR